MVCLNFKVDSEKCIKCGFCVKDCSVGAITLDNNGYPVADANKCFGCQHCMAICPQSAISVFDKNPEESFTSKDNDIESLIKMRRSCRHYKNEAISKDKLEKLKNIVNWAPTGCNHRGLHFAVVESPEKMIQIKNDLYSIIKNNLNSQNPNPMLLRWADAINSGYDFIFRNAPHMIVVSVDKNSPCKNYDPIIALSYFEMYAQSLGIGTLWCGLAYWTMPECKKVMDMLQIPDNYEFAYVMIFGEPNVHYARSIQPEQYKMTII